MPDSASPAENRPEGFNADALRALNSLNFGPSWASGNAPAPKAPTPRRDEETTGGSPAGERRDRRGFDRPRQEFTPRPAGDRPAPQPRSDDRAPRPAGQEPRAFTQRSGEGRPPRSDFAPNRDGGARPPRPAGAPGERGPRPESRDFNRDGGERRDHGRREFTPRPAPFRPIVETTFYPEEKPFGALLKTLKDSCRTVELFEIARSVLEKLERFQISVKPLDAEKNPEARIFQSIPDSLPFLSEAEAFDYAFKALADTLYTTEIVAAEPPKGTFTAIARCGITGEFIAPSTYHGYQKALRDHHAAQLGNMAFERFVSSVESVKDEAAIAAWIEKKKNVPTYVLTTRTEAEPERFATLEALKAHLLATRKELFVKALPFVRFAGKDAEKMPAGPLRESVEHELAFQRKFPLDTANAIRGRLRKAGFALYKRGAKGVTFLCGVKRCFRTAATPAFPEAVAKVFDAIENHPGAASGKYITGAELREKLIGAKPEETSATYDAAQAELSATVHTLVRRGYVIEFADGRLYALPIQTEAAARAAAAEDAGATATEGDKTEEQASPEA